MYVCSFVAQQLSLKLIIQLGIYNIDIIINKGLAQMQTAQIFWFLQVDDVNLHGKDNQQAVEILKQTGPVVRLKVARHVNRKYSRSYTAGSVSSQASSGLLEALPATMQAKSAVRKQRKGRLIPMYCSTSTDTSIN